MKKAMEESIVPSPMEDLKLSKPLIERGIWAYKNVPYYCGEVDQTRTWRGKSTLDLTLLEKIPRSRRVSNAHSLCYSATCSRVPMTPFTDCASKEPTYRLRMTQPISKKTWTMEQDPSSPNALRSDSKKTWTMEMLNASMEQDPSSPNASSPSRNARTMEAPIAPPSSITATPYEECGQCSSNL